MFIDISCGVFFQLITLYLHFKVVGAGLDLTIQVTSYLTREYVVWLYSQKIFGETEMEIPFIECFNYFSVVNKFCQLDVV